MATGTAVAIQRSGPAIRANPLSEQEQAQLARAKSGDFTGLWERDEAGNWAQL